MNPIAYITSDLTKVYNDFGIFSRIKDRFKVQFENQLFLKEFDTNIIKISIPPNINESAYMNNVSRAGKYARNPDLLLAPKTYRFLDYKVFNDFQMNLFGFSVVNSTRLILRSMHKSIRESCIILYDACHFINERIINYLAQEARYVILVSENNNKLKLLQEYVSANYGISVIITSELSIALQSADFIITSTDIGRDTNIPVWYLNNLYTPIYNSGLLVNDVSFKVPWDVNGSKMPLELVGALLSQMEEKDVEKSLISNDICIDNFTFGASGHQQFN